MGLEVMENIGDTFPPHLARSQSGLAVKEGKAFVPEVLFKGQYYPICGREFWDNNNGATIVCKTFGFNSGTLAKTGGKFGIDSMPAGRCSPTDADLTKCTGGGNTWGDLSAREGTCKKGNEIGFTVTCKDPGLCDRDLVTWWSLCTGLRFGLPAH